MPKKDQCGRDKRQDVAQERALDHTGVRHIVLRQVLGQIGIDARRDEAGALVLCRFFVGSLDDVVGDRNILDLARL